MRGEDTNTGSTTPCPGPTRSPRETSATSGLAGTCGGAVGGASTIGTAVGGAATLVGCASATLTSDEGWTGTRVGATGAGDGDSLVPARRVFAPASAAFCISLRRKASWRCASSWMVFASAGGADGGVGRGVIALSTAAVAGGAVTAAAGGGDGAGLRTTSHPATASAMEAAAIRTYSRVRFFLSMSAEDAGKDAAKIPAGTGFGGRLRGGSAGGAGPAGGGAGGGAEGFAAGSGC